MKTAKKHILTCVKKRIQKYVDKILKVGCDHLTYNKAIAYYLDYHKINITSNLEDWLLSQYKNKESFLYLVKIKKPSIAKKAEKIKTFYDSDAWEILRKLTLQKYGCVCMKCKARKTEMHVDHIKPRSKYPELELDENNLQVLCKNCNLEKSNKNEIDYR